MNCMIYVKVRINYAVFILGLLFSDQVCCFYIRFVVFISGILFVCVCVHNLIGIVALIIWELINTQLIGSQFEHNYT